MNQPPSGTVTFLFTDIEGSTQLAQRYREHWEALRARHNAILQQAVQAHDGHVFQIIGDAFCVAFGTAVDALKAAVDAQRMLQQEPWSPAPIKVRMGIHSGTARASGDSAQAGDYKGYTALARTQRLMSAGHGGQVLVSRAAEELLSDELPEDLALRDIGERRLKDLNRPERIFQAVSAGLPADFPPLKTLDAYRHNLPVQMTSFIGREQEMAEVKLTLTRHRLVTLTGSGGTGKTRVALQVAADVLDQFPDGVWFAGLAVLTDAELIPQTILASVGIREQPGRTPIQSVLDYLRDRNVLLVLDNCEHLRQACVAVVEPLLRSANGLKIIATSREALGVEGEAIRPVPSMTLPDPRHLPSIQQLSEYEAVQLFVARALLVQSTFAVTKNNSAAIAQICFHLDGIPLAIELAAARVRALSPEQVARRLDDRFSVLTGGKRTGLPHQQTLRLAIDWSYDLLSEPEQDLLQRLSVFAGGWSLEAGEAMAMRVEPVHDSWLDVLTGLVDKSLVAQHPETERYSMLETVQHYALEKLSASGRLQACQTMHQRYFIGLAEESDGEVYALAGKETEWRRMLGKDSDNLRLALGGLVRGNRSDEALRLAGALGWFWGSSIPFGEASDWLEQILAMKEPASASARARATLALGRVRWAQGKNTAAKALCLESLEAHRAAGDLEYARRSLYTAGLATEAMNEHAEALALLEESLLLARQSNLMRGIVAALNALGYLRHRQADYAAAEKLYRESLALTREVGDERLSAVCLDNLGSLTYDRQDWVEARKYHEQALEVWRNSNEPWFLAMNLSGLANVLYQEGRQLDSARLQGFVDRLCNEIGAKLQLLELDEYVRTAAALKVAPGEAGYQQALVEGRALSLEQAIELALTQL